MTGSVSDRITQEIMYFILAQLKLYIIYTFILGYKIKINFMYENCCYIEIAIYLLETYLFLVSFSASKMSYHVSDHV